MLSMVIATGKDFVDETQTTALEWEGGRCRQRQREACSNMLNKWKKELRKRRERREKADTRKKAPAACAFDTLMYL